MSLGLKLLSLGHLVKIYLHVCIRYPGIFGSDVNTGRLRWLRKWVFSTNLLVLTHTHLNPHGIDEYQSNKVASPCLQMVSFPKPSFPIPPLLSPTLTHTHTHMPIHLQILELDSFFQMRKNIYHNELLLNLENGTAESKCCQPITCLIWEFSEVWLLSLEEVWRRLPFNLCDSCAPLVHPGILTFDTNIHSADCWKFSLSLFCVYLSLSLLQALYTVIAMSRWIKWSCQIDTHYTNTIVK